MGRRRRGGRRIMVTALAAILLLGAWGAVDALRAQRRLAAARSALTAVAGDTAGLADPGRRAAGVERLRAASGDARAAAAVIQASVPLRIVAVVPAVGAQRNGVRRLGEDVADASADAARALEVAGSVVEANAATPGQLVPVDRIGEVQTALGAAARTLRRTTRGSASLLGPVADARRQYDELAGEHGRTLQDAADALGAAGPFAGAAGPRRYLVLGLNNAEMRDTGMALSYAVVRAEGGRFTVERRGSVNDLRLTRPVEVATPEGTAALFDALAPRQTWQSVNATADWPWTARAAIAMYGQATGQDVDGVLAIDVAGLQEVLEVTGPVRAEGIDGEVSAGNAADLLLRDLYDRLPPGSDQGPRREAVAGVAAAVMDALRDRTPDRVALAQALARAAAGGHLKVASNAPAEQEVFARLGPGDGPDGPTAETAARTFHYGVHNGNGTKLDYHLRTRVTFDVTTTEAGNAVVRTTVAVQNAAPAGTAPSYALGPNLGLDHPPGRYDGRVYLWGPAGADQQGSVVDAGLPTSQSVVQVEPGGGTASARFETVLRGAAAGGRLALRLVPQSRLRPATVEVRINGRTVRSGEWRTVVDEEWPVGDRP